MRPARVQHDLGAHDVGHDELGGSADRTIDVGLGRGMDHARSTSATERLHDRGVGDVALHEPEPVIAVVVGEVLACEPA